MILEVNNLSSLHFKSIRISPENTFWIKIIIHFPVNSYVFTETITNLNSSNFDVKLYQTFEELRRKSHSDHSATFKSTVLCCTLESDWILIDILSLLIHNIRSIVRWVWILLRFRTKFWLKGPDAFWIRCFFVDNVVFLVFFHLIIRNWRDAVALVVF